MKKCSSCKKRKLEKNFYKNKSTKDGLTQYCVDCCKQRYHETKHKFKTTRKKYSEQNQEKLMFHAAKSRAKKFNLPFEIEESDIIIPKKCPIFNIPLKRHEGRTRSPNSPSLDRIHNGRGYTKDNIKVISWKANELKRNASLMDLRKLVKYMEENLNV